MITTKENDSNNNTTCVQKKAKGNRLKYQQAAIFGNCVIRDF